MSDKTQDKIYSEALFGKSITEVIKQTKIGFDTHFGTINAVYFDEHDTPRESSPDLTPHFIHSLEQWFKFFSMKNKTPTLKIEKANGQGFVIALIPISQHKTKDNWFLFFMEKEGWRNKDGEYWKDGVKFQPQGERVTITKNVGLPNELSLDLRSPGDELQVKVMLELLK